MSVFSIQNLAVDAGEKQAKPQVLLVDDEPANLKMLGHLLADDFEVHCAEDGFAAIELLDNMADPAVIQLVICDQRMNNMSGFELLKKINQRMPQTIRIIVSGTVNARSIEASTKQAGLYGFITKPIDPADFLQTMRNAISAFLERRQLQGQCQALAMEVQVISEQLADKKLDLEQTKQKLKQLNPIAT